MLEVIGIEDALVLTTEKHEEQEVIMVSLNESLNYVVAKDIVAKENVPSFNRSLVDGYCVKSKDVFGASLSIPAMLSFQGSIEMGEHPKEELKDGHCIYVPTGGELAPGSDAVVMIEYVEDMDDGFRYMMKPVAPGEGVTYLGDDVKIDQVLVRKGERVSSKIVGVLSSLGYDEVPVYKKLKVSILATGDEIVATGSKISGAKVRDINNPLLASLMNESGCDVKIYGIVKDNEEDIRFALNEMISSSDIVLVSGGSSVGEKDKTLEILESFDGANTVFHGLALKPGKPTMYVKMPMCDVFGLPGHPLACYFVFQALLKPYVASRYQSKDPSISVQAISKVSIGSNHGREECMIVKTEVVDGKLYFEPLPSKSGMISRLASGDAYLRIPRDKEGIDENEICNIVKI